MTTFENLKTTLISLYQFTSGFISWKWIANVVAIKDLGGKHGSTWTITSMYLQFHQIVFLAALRFLRQNLFRQHDIPMSTYSRNELLFITDLWCQNSNGYFHFIHSQVVEHSCLNTWMCGVKWCTIKHLTSSCVSVVLIYGTDFEHVCACLANSVMWGTQIIATSDQDMCSA